MHAFETRPENTEGDYDVSEIFFSRTDPSGIIRAGNDVFQRVSGHDWSSLINAPHNIIRHKDMSKGVFCLLWQTIKQGNPIAAYVKNKSKNGKEYWVLALAMPVDGGYISVRIKPTSALFGVIKKEYDDFIKKEHAEKLSPEKSLEMIASRIQELGFSSYKTFMTHALFTEWGAREAALNRDVDLVHLLKELSDLGSVLLKEAGTLLSAMKIRRFLPLNLEIESAKMGKDGDSISAVALQYQKTVVEIEAEAKNFENSVSLVLEKLEDAQFLLCASQLMSEVASVFEKQTDSHEVDRGVEMVYLTNKSNEEKSKALAGLMDARKALDVFQDSIQLIRSLLLSLEIVMITGKIESSRIDQHAAAFNELMNQLKQFQVTLIQAVDKMNKCTKGLKENSNKILLKPFFRKV